MQSHYCFKPKLRVWDITSITNNDNKQTKPNQQMLHALD